MKSVSLGGVCADFTCAICCKDTKMMLSLDDIEKIEKLEYKKNDFCFLDEDGYFKLCNINGNCFFLVDNKCQIYADRPQGCKFYPIIFDLDLNKASLDNDCPLIHTISEKTLQSFTKDLKKFVRSLLREKAND
ncbi:MAG: YkgJ family cysteine cluster protein [Candidatus Heimdallarchaeota archaeon]|nr:MAG: YkgJ family cysteine cluster protein [Candidatus Heimdallarchaeota archaeon]